MGKRGDLGRFLEAIQSGAVSRGSILIAENARQNVTKQVIYFPGAPNRPRILICRMPWSPCIMLK